MSRLSRRSLLKGAGLAGAATTFAPALSPQPAAAQQREGYLFFTEPEAAFVEAAVDRLIPPDDDWAGAREAGVSTYIDRQLNGPYGRGHRLYLQGPWKAGTPEQGYQLRLTPAELYRASLRSISELARERRDFASMNGEEQDAFLEELEAGEHDLGGFPSSIFFETLLANTVEGFFADPAYGGNRDKIGWRMIGFPGAYAAYHGLYTRHGMQFDREPVGMDEIGHAHHMPPEE